jgi:ubiquinone/menaquinone biosynthesis C-methylase UbiE
MLPGHPESFLTISQVFSARRLAIPGRDRLDQREGGIMPRVDLGFKGEVADFYHRYRHGYPGAVLDALADAFGLTRRDVVVDLGCGTGQLTLPMAARVRAVVGMDPEPDMLQRARQAAGERDVRNVSLMVGADTDIPALRGLLGDHSVAAVTIGQALHWMNHTDLFAAAIPLVRGGGGVAVVTNGTPLWLQDTDWSCALRDYLEHWLDTKLTSACGTDEQSQRRYRQDLASAGFDVLETAIDYVAELDLDQLVGGIYSALPVSRLPMPDERPVFAEEIRRAVAPSSHFSEHVHVAILAGRVP